MRSTHWVHEWTISPLWPRSRGLASGRRQPSWVRNEGLADLAADREDAFARVLRHSAYKSAVERGAIEVWMPRLDAAVAQAIEAKRVSFLQARDALSPKGRKVAPFGPFDRTRVRQWLRSMAAEMAPILSWLP